MIYVPTAMSLLQGRIKVSNTAFQRNLWNTLPPFFSHSLYMTVTTRLILFPSQVNAPGSAYEGTGNDQRLKRALRREEVSLQFLVQWADNEG